MKYDRLLKIESCQNNNLVFSQVFDKLCIRLSVVPCTKYDGATEQK